MTLSRLVFSKLTDGVSKQPPIQRQPSYCEDMVNAEPDIINGLSKRRALSMLKADIIGTDPVILGDIGIRISDTLYAHVVFYSEVVESVVTYRARSIKVDPTTDTVTLSDVTTMAAGTETLEYLTGWDADPGPPAIAARPAITPEVTRLHAQYVESANTHMILIYRNDVNIERNAASLKANSLPFVLLVGSAGEVDQGLTTNFFEITQKVADTPDQSFVGRPITALTTWQNRLVIAANDSIVLSYANAPGDFWPDALDTVNPADPIDFRLLGSRTSVRHMIEYSESLYVFTEDAVYKVTAGDNSIEPGNLRAKKITALSANTMPPFIYEDVLIFQSKDNKVYALDREDKATDVSIAVPGYITLAFQRYEVFNDTLLFYRTDSNVVYVLNYKVAQDSTVQLAWHKWELSSTVQVELGFAFDSKLYLAAYSTSAGSVHLLHLENLALDCGIEVLMDFAEEASVTSGSLVVPDHYDSTAGRAFIAGTYALYRKDTGEQMTLNADMSVTDPTGASIDDSDFTVILGINYEFSFVFSKQYPRDNMGRGLNKERLQYRSITVSYEDSVALDIRIQSPQRTDYVYEFRSIRKNSDLYEYDTGLYAVVPSLLSIDDTMYAYGDSMDTVLSLESSEPYPVTISSVTIEALVYTRFR